MQPALPQLKGIPLQFWESSKLWTPLSFNLAVLVLAEGDSLLYAGSTVIVDIHNCLCALTELRQEHFTESFIKHKWSGNWLQQVKGGV